jgi:glutaredoxin
VALISVNVNERYRDTLVTVQGSREQSRTIFLYAISTCMWCKLGKSWLNDRGYTYTYLDIDKIPVDEKNQIKQELGKLTGDTPSFPFVVIDGERWHAGYDPSTWEKLLSEGNGA